MTEDSLARGAWWDAAIEVAALERAVPTLAAIGCPIGRDARAFLRERLESVDESPLTTQTAERLAAALAVVDAAAARSLTILRTEEFPMIWDADVIAWTPVLLRLANVPPHVQLPAPMERAKRVLDAHLVGGGATDDAVTSPPDPRDADWVVFTRSEPPTWAADWLGPLRTQHAVRTSWHAVAQQLPRADLGQLISWGREQYESGRFSLPRLGDQLRVPPWVPADEA